MRKKNSPTSSPTANKKDRKAGKPGELTAEQNGKNLVLRLSAFFSPLPRSRGREDKKGPGCRAAKPSSRTLLLSNIKNKFWARNWMYVGLYLTIGSLRNRTAVRLRTAEWRKNVARDCAFLVLRDIFIRHSAVLSLPAVLLRKVANKTSRQQGAAELTIARRKRRRVV